MKHYWYLNYLNCCIFWSFFVSIFREKVKSREETLAANAAAKSLSLFEYAWKHFKWTTFSNKVLSSALTITVSLSLSLSLTPLELLFCDFVFLTHNIKEEDNLGFEIVISSGFLFQSFFVLLSRPLGFCQRAATADRDQNTESDFELFFFFSTIRLTFLCKTIDLIQQLRRYILRL